MTATAHIYEIFIRAPRERVWEALVDPDVTVEYFHRTRIESSFIPGERYRYVLADDRDAVEGVIEVFEPPRRLVMTFRVLYDAAMSEEPPSRVEWTLTPVGDDDVVTRVTLRHGDLALSPLTWQNVRLGWVGVIDSLKSYLETGTSLPPLEIDDVGDPTETEGNWHRAQAVDANNSAWALLARSEHSADDADELLHRVYAAAYHWNRATGGTDVNRARGSWLISRAHAVLGHGELALHHADQCARWVSQSASEASDFDHGYVHEARARALACLGRLDEAGDEFALAASTVVADDDDRTIYEGDLATEPWYGLERPDRRGP